LLDILQTAREDGKFYSAGALYLNCIAWEIILQDLGFLLLFLFASDDIKIVVEDPEAE
jgi:hypothetical protein